MNEVLSVFILLTEILMILQCLQIVFKQELPFDKYMVGIIVIDFIIYMGINLKAIPMICSCIFYVLTYVFCLIKFKQTKMKTAIRLIIALCLAGGIEGIFAFVTNFVRTPYNLLPIMALSSSLALILAWVIKVSIPSIVIDRKANKRGVWGIVVFYGISYAGVLIEYYTKYRLVSIYVVLILLFVAFILFYFYRLEQTQNEINKKNYELELQNIYGGAYEKLLLEVRRRQHDYKNQLGAIYSMQLTAGSLEELVAMQKEYGDALQSDCKFDSILTGCKNQILAGFLYHKCIDCEQKGVAVEYTIHIEQADCDFALHELIELLGILIDNACESVVDQTNDHKQIRLDFQENEEKILFSVSNPASYVSFSQIERMFTLGYSSKGENRGLGLARAKELINKYGAEMQVENIVLNDENWIEFKVEIEKLRSCCKIDE